MIDTFENYEAPRHGPDDLMDIPIRDLIRKLARRVERLREFRRLKADPMFIRKEKRLIRIAETAARARVRELTLFTADLLEETE